MTFHSSAHTEKESHYATAPQRLPLTITSFTTDDDFFRRCIDETDSFLN